MVQDGMDILNVLPQDVKKVQCNFVFLASKCHILNWETEGGWRGAGKSKRKDGVRLKDKCVEYDEIIPHLVPTYELH